MATALLFGLILLLQLSTAGPVTSLNSNRPCINFILPVSATAQQTEYDILHVEDNINATAFAVDLDTWSFDLSRRTLRNITISETFNISVQLCVPAGPKKDNLIIATHGFPFDKRYWDITIDPSEYSFVDAALAAGYSILTYDRLGNGQSDKPDAYSVVQAPIQLEILRGITTMARSGEILKHSKGTSDLTGISNSTVNGSDTSFEKIIHIGHSFGSGLTAAFLASYGNLSDAAVLTGYIPNEHMAEVRRTSFGLEYAPQNDPTLFGDRSPGYLVPGTTSSFQAIFFSTQVNATSGIGGFDTEVFDYGFSIRQTGTASELTAPFLESGPAVAFRGPLQFMLAEFDFAICRGDCRGVYDLEALRQMYPSVSGDIDVYTQAGTGHALTMHREASLGYKATLDWLERNGL